MTKWVVKQDYMFNHLALDQILDDTPTLVAAKVTQGTLKPKITLPRNEM